MGARYCLVILGLLACAVGRSAPAAETADPAQASAKLLATEVCSACHGPAGRSAFSAIPNLAAQPWPYLLAKMKAFRIRAGRESEDHIDVLGLMLIDDATQTALAHYYADQSPAPPVAGDAALIAAGERIYTRGDSGRGIAACAACHGAQAAGFWIFPRLAGQHAEYVERQILGFQSRLRDSRVMHGILKNISAGEVKAVAAYVQSK